MARTCKADEAPPPQCLEAFSRISGQLGSVAAKLDAIHDQTARTNGHVATLFERTGRHDTEIRLLQADANGVRRGRAAWTRRLWQLLIGLALVLAGYLIKT